MVESKNNECANALKEAEHVSKGFGFTAGILKVVLAEGRTRR